MNHISLQMFTLREHTATPADLENTLEKLREIGLTTIQYTVPDAFGIRETKRLLDTYGITNDSDFCDVLQLEEREALTLERCEILETDHIRTNSIPHSLTQSAAGYKMFAHYLNEATTELKRHGKKLMYHFHAFEFRRFGDKTGLQILLEETDPAVIQLLPDTHWIHSGGKEILPFLETYRDRFDYVHVKDFAIGSMGPTWESRPICFAPVGEGNLNWAPVLDWIRANGITSVAIEQDECYGRDPFDCVKSSFDFLRANGVNV